MDEPRLSRRAAEFADLYERHLGDVYGYLAHRCSARETAEDLTQLTFERALRGWQRFDPTRGSTRTWLLAIARNALIDEVRRPIRETPHDPGRAEDLAAGTAPGPETLVIGLDPRLAGALGRLQQAEREVLALRYGGGMSAREAADLLGISEANAHQINSRALRKLRAELTDP